MDPFFATVMAAEVMALAIIVGGVLMFPTARRMGRYVEMLIEERRNRLNPPKDVQELTEELERTREELARLNERQAFVEALLASRPAPALAAGDDAAP
ncbi:MAG TPA: hypothetical protein VF092_22750 [Longimicrobium sp.]